MHTLLLRLAGPMQAWGLQSRFPDRDTGLEPSKSGVVGLLCAALGKPRDERPDDDHYPKLAKITALRMGVRVDRQGTLMYDYHTAQNVRVAAASVTDRKVAEVLAGKRKDEKGNILRDSVSTRHYLADARFLVGMESPDLSLLTELHNALCNPVWPLYLGRKAFVPGDPVWLEDGLCSDLALSEALETYPWLGCNSDRRAEQVRLVLEDADGSEVRPDQPLSFAERRFAPRRVSTTFIPAPLPREEDDLCTSPD
jgi:CRISPR system Cascade subunit CasD